MDPAVLLTGSERFHLGGREEAADAGPRAILSRRYLLQTLVLWGACFLSLGNIALLSNWLPTYFQELGGVPIQQFAKYLMIGFIGGAVGTLTMGWFMARVNQFWLICGFYVLYAVAVAALGQPFFRSLGRAPGAVGVCRISDEPSRWAKVVRPNKRSS